MRDECLSKMRADASVLCHSSDHSSLITHHSQGIL